jgi:hypothetical protein
VNEETKDHQELKVLQVILAPEVILAVMECKEQKDQWDLLENLEMMDYQEDLARMAFLELRVHKVSRVLEAPRDTMDDQVLQARKVLQVLLVHQDL